MQRRENTMYEKVFRTFCKGCDKASAEPHKGIEQVRTWDECQSMSSFGGILQPDFIDVSFDDAEMSEKFLDMAEANDWACVAIENPENHHLHTFWKSPKQWRNGADKLLAVGFIADIHNKETYIPIRVNGVTRECVYPDDDSCECQDLPEELWPVKTDLKFWKMAEGKGRNNDLYKYILTLTKKEKMDSDTVRRVIRNINRFVLASPLSEDELNVILRDDAFPDEQEIITSDFYGGANGNTFLHAKFAEYMISTFHVCRVNGQMAAYYNGKYSNQTKDIEKAMISVIYSLSDRNRKEALKSMALMVPDERPADARYIAFKNGIYDTETRKMQENSPDFVIENVIPWNYDPDAQCEPMNHMLDKISCYDPQIRRLLEEMVGYTFLRRNEMRKSFMLIGKKRNGKSTFLDCVKYLLGRQNYSALDISELGDRFRTAMIAGKLANIGDDIGDDFLKGNQVAIFKKITAGNMITAEIKGQDPFDFDPYVKLMFSANDIPRMRDKTGAVIDRLVIIPFNAVFDKSDPDYDPFIKDKLLTSEGMEYLIRVGVEGLHRVLAAHEFSHSDAVDAAIAEYNSENNTLAGFMEDADLDTDIIGKTTQEVMLQYQEWCDTNGFERGFGGVALSKYIVTNFNIVKKQVRNDGKRERIFAYKV